MAQRSLDPSTATGPLPPRLEWIAPLSRANDPLAFPVRMVLHNKIFAPQLNRS